MTGDEFDTLTNVDEFYVYELVRGVLLVNPIPSSGERGPNDELGFLLRLYRHQHPEGSALDETLSEEHIHLGPLNRRRADRAIWIGLGRAPDPDRDVPTVVVEFVSRSKRDRTRDYETKRGEYLDHGVIEYWVVDRFDRRMTVYRRPPAEPAETVVPEDGTYRAPLLPGFELPLARLLGVADRLESARAKRPRRRRRDGGG